MKNLTAVGYVGLGLCISACVVNGTPANSRPPATTETAAPPVEATTPAAVDAKPTPAAATPAVNAGAMAVSPPVMKEVAIEGRPKDYKAGVPESFWVWQDAKGNGWNVRVSTKEKLHRFHGFIVGDNNLKNVKATKTEWTDRLRHKEKRAAFDFYVNGGADGIDFNAEPGTCVRFFLMIDGKAADTQRIFLGKDGVHPEKSHFKLCK
jgi:hypothetical protein